MGENRPHSDIPRKVRPQGRKTHAERGKLGLLLHQFNQRVD
jgi:hypothetical protein